MESNTVKVLFLISATRKNQQGLVPLFCRITYKRKRKQFATGFFIKPKHWYSKQQIAKPPSEDIDNLNTQLSLIKTKINQALLYLQVNENLFDVEDIYLQFIGKNVKSSKTLLEVFELHNKRMKRLRGIEYTNSTYRKFLEAKKHIANFIKHQFAKNDILLEAIKSNFLENFDYYLKTEKEQKQITINKSIQRVRKIIKVAISEGYLRKDPFILYKPKRYEKSISYLTVEELGFLEEYRFAQTRLEHVCDMFVFCCYTGLAYAEMSNLTQRHIVMGFDNERWIEMYRQKTKSKVSVPLLPKADIILDKYKCFDSESEKLLPIISNQKFNSYLKEIAEIVGIKKRLTHHMGRKTFATTVLLYNDVPMEIVSKLLGHSKMQTTQEHYGEIVQKKISEEMIRLNKKFKL